MAELARSYFVRAEEMPAYGPANHTGTVNRRLIGPETVGARNMEVVLGTLEKGGAALPHAHPEMEQACYLLAGRARVESADRAARLGPMSAASSRQGRSTCSRSSARSRFGCS